MALVRVKWRLPRPRRWGPKPVDSAPQHCPSRDVQGGRRQLASGLGAVQPGFDMAAAQIEASGPQHAVQRSGKDMHALTAIALALGRRLVVAELS